MDKTKGRWVKAREGGGFGWGGESMVGGKCIEQQLNNNKIIFKNLEGCINEDYNSLG